MFQFPQGRGGVSRKAAPGAFYPRGRVRGISREGGAMYVGRRMTRNLITVTGDTNILKVKNLLKQYNIDQVPVVEGKRIVGIITDKDIRRFTASPASTLSVHELNYLLSEMRAEEIMTKKVFTVTPGTPIEEAAKLINEKRVNSLPVVTGDELVGIITTCDLLNVLLEFLGVGLPSRRFEVTFPNRKGEIARIASMINDFGLAIVSMITAAVREGSPNRTAILRLEGPDPSALIEALKDAGYQVAAEYQGRAKNP